MEIRLVSNDDDSFHIDYNIAINSDYIRSNYNFSPNEDIKIPYNSEFVTIIMDILELYDNSDELSEYLSKYDLNTLLYIKEIINYLGIDINIINDIILEQIGKQYPGLNKTVVVYTISKYDMIPNLIATFNTIHNAEKHIPNELIKYNNNDITMYYIPSSLRNKYNQNKYLVVQENMNGYLDIDKKKLREIIQFIDDDNQDDKKIVNVDILVMPDLPPLNS